MKRDVRAVVLRAVRRSFAAAAAAFVWTIPAHAAGPSEGTVRYLAPDALRQAPAFVVKALKAYGCRVPQVESVTSKNVIRGEFVARGQIAWAALCSRNGMSSILLITEQEGKCPEHARGSDAAYVQQTSGGEKQYSRMISTVRRKDIVRRVQRLRQAPLVPEQIDHDGVEDAFLEKASTILYCENGNWVELRGAD